MEKIIIKAETFAKLTILCEKIGLDNEFKPEEKAASYFENIIELGRIMSQGAEKLEGDADDALDFLFDKNVSGAVSSLSLALEKAGELTDYASKLQDSISNALEAIRDCTVPDAWAPLCTDEEVKAALDRGFGLTCCMSLGFKDSKYALLFEQENDENKLVCEPFIVAVGRDEDAHLVRAYIENFMDMEEESDLFDDQD